MRLSRLEVLSISISKHHLMFAEDGERNRPRQRQEKGGKDLNMVIHSNTRVKNFLTKSVILIHKLTSLVNTCDYWCDKSAGDRR